MSQLADKQFEKEYVFVQASMLCATHLVADRPSAILGLQKHFRTTCIAGKISNGPLLILEAVRSAHTRTVTFQYCCMSTEATSAYKHDTDQTTILRVLDQVQKNHASRRFTGPFLCLRKDVLSRPSLAVTKLQQKARSISLKDLRDASKLIAELEAHDSTIIFRRVASQLPSHIV